MVGPIAPQPWQPSQQPPQDQVTDEVKYYIQALLDEMQLAKNNGEITSQQYNTLKQQLGGIDNASSLQQWIRTTSANNPSNEFLTSLPSFTPFKVDWAYQLFVNYLQKLIDQTSDPAQKSNLVATLKEFEHEWDAKGKNASPQDLMNLLANFAVGTGFPQPNPADWPESNRPK